LKCPRRLASFSAASTRSRRKKGVASVIGGPLCSQPNGTRKFCAGHYQSLLLPNTPDTSPARRAGVRGKQKKRVPRDHWDKRGLNEKRRYGAGQLELGEGVNTTAKCQIDEQGSPLNRPRETGQRGGLRLGILKLGCAIYVLRLDTRGGAEDGIRNEKHLGKVRDSRCPPLAGRPKRSID